MRALGINTDDIRQAVRLHYQKEFLGTYDVEQGASGRQWICLALVPEQEGREFNAERIKVKMKDGKIIGLNELGEGFPCMEEQPQNYYRINGLNSIYLSIVAEETAKSIGIE